MSIYDEGNSIFNDDALYDDIGVLRETYPQPVTGTRSIQIKHWNVFHGRPSDPDSADLRSHLHDVGLLSAALSSSQHDPCFKAQSAPWHPVRNSGHTNENVRSCARLGGTSLTRRESNEYSKSAHYGKEPYEAGDAHSSINGISQWEDSTVEHEVPADSYAARPVQSTSVARSSSDVWSADDLLSQDLSPLTPSSQQDCQTGSHHQEDLSNQSMPSPCVGLGKPVTSEESSFQGAFDSIEMTESRPSVTKDSADSSRNTDSTRPHVCSVCGTSFKTRSGVKHHEKTHDPAKKEAHKCPVCNRGFQHPKDVRRHLTSHEEPEQHCCGESGCSRVFSRKDNAMRHRRREHASSV